MGNRLGHRIKVVRSFNSGEKCLKNSKTRNILIILSHNCLPQILNARNHEGNHAVRTAMTSGWRTLLRLLCASNNPDVPAMSPAAATSFQLLPGRVSAVGGDRKGFSLATPPSRVAVHTRTTVPPLSLPPARRVRSRGDVTA